jgi:uncharacterized RDD family membrane protein YckC
MSTAPSEPNPYAPPKAEVADHRNGDVESQLASRGARLAAFALDSLGYMLTFVPLMAAINFEALIRAATANDSAAMLDAISMVAANAQTVGKRLIGIKVARTDGSHAGFARIFWLRNVVNTLPSMIPFVGVFYPWLIDPLFVFGESRRCIHDHIADTIVVNA